MLRSYICFSRSFPVESQCGDMHSKCCGYFEKTVNEKLIQKFKKHRSFSVFIIAML